MRYLSQHNLKAYAAGSRFCLLALAIAALSACAIRPRSSRDGYRVIEIRDRYFVMAPDASRIQKEIRTTAEGKPSPNINCAIHGTWFSLNPGLSRKGRRWLFKAPRSEDWLDDAKRVDISDDWLVFFRKLGELRRNGCLTQKDYSVIKQSAAERLSSAEDENLYFYYSLGRGGFLDLTEGMRLHIQRLIPGTGREGSQEHVATSKISEIFYNVLLTQQGVLSLGKIQAGVAPKNLEESGETLPETTLASWFTADPFLRIFLQDLSVRADVKSPAVLIGSQTLTELDAATDVLLERSNSPCKAVTKLQVTCIAFDGPVSVSPMVAIYINGKQSFVPIGTSLTSLLLGVRPEKQKILMKSVLVKRLFDGKYLDVRFRSDAAMRQFLLVAGDKVSSRGLDADQGLLTPPR